MNVQVYYLEKTVWEAVPCVLNYTRIFECTGLDKVWYIFSSDVDECLHCERPRCKYPCDHKCHNNDGSFTCSCENGYDLVQDTKCVGT